MDVGKLRITKHPGGKKPEIVFTLKDELNSTKPNEACPKEHKFVVSPIGHQSLTVVSHAPMDSAASKTSHGEAITEKMQVEGKVKQRAECRPHADANYMKLKRIQFVEASKPTRVVQQLQGVVQTYKPVSNHENNIKWDKEKKEQGKKSRADKDQVMDMLFSAFEKHQYYNIKDLVRTTNQPVTYLKEILKEICVYNIKAPHRNMWELKPEYRHYKEDKEKDS
ncbi:PREDICTED: general transcription factor IIF subunit 2-like isoform X2 [Priapulus caudatus]|nr:PREDICTED: general transcription factor IIF subunit 2-like isoform X2 [Priapulus caudatus]XP_014661749.1 PREDICTED: general transcription factor IIF subunit 2-like isoform X2 [Priapulus caudatus]